MTSSPEARLAELGITLPDPTPPLASYVPFVVSGSTVYVSGQVPLAGGTITRTGAVGRDVSIEDAASDARVCAINALAHLRAAAGGSLDNVARIVKVGVFVASSDGFHAQPAVANGASDLFVEVFGDAGRHARAAVGVAELPLGCTVEVELIAELRPDAGS